MDDLDDREVAAFARTKAMDHHRGYVAVQSTRPQTLGYALEDSPAGLLAWIADKFWAWTDHDEDVLTAVQLDDLLTNVSVYWFTATATSAMRLYYETIGLERIHLHPIHVPLGLAVFPKELTGYRRRWVEREHNLVHWTEFERGGHFPALEVPDMLVGDLRTFFAPLR
jgi:microsomal epoxide hydrolase